MDPWGFSNDSMESGDTGGGPIRWRLVPPLSSTTTTTTSSTSTSTLSMLLNSTTASPLNSTEGISVFHAREVDSIRVPDVLHFLYLIKGDIGKMVCQERLRVALESSISCLALANATAKVATSCDDPVRASEGILSCIYIIYSERRELKRCFQNIKNMISTWTSRIFRRAVGNDQEEEMNIEQHFHKELLGLSGEIRKEFAKVQISFPDLGVKSDIVKLRGPKKDVDDCKTYISRIVKDMQESSFQVKVPIFKQFHKYIIGEGGANIRRICDEADTKVDLPDSGSESDMIIITGRKPNVNKAVAEIQKIQNEMANVTRQEVKTPGKTHDAKSGAGTAEFPEPKSASPQEKAKLELAQTTCARVTKDVLMGAATPEGKTRAAPHQSDQLLYPQGGDAIIQMINPSSQMIDPSSFSAVSGAANGGTHQEIVMADVHQGDQGDNEGLNTDPSVRKPKKNSWCPII